MKVIEAGRSLRGNKTSGEPRPTCMTITASAHVAMAANEAAEKASRFLP